MIKTTPCKNCPDTTYSAVSRVATKTITQPAVTCSECGGLECLCRPRFFDGQLLSADDLTRLEHYIVKKNRLHNRVLHGWGVVCGLEVVCDPCEDQVIVRQGYALSPCGDDIVVCENAAVPICELIKECRNTAAYDDCYSSRLNAEERGCEESLENWTLLVCYDEKPSRGITPLRAGSGAACCSRCACGGSSSCGCSCHEKSTSAAKTSFARVSPQCEPSLICEGFHFEVRKASLPGNGKLKLFQGEMIDRFLECYRELISIIPEFPQDTSNLEQLRQFCCDFKDALKEFFTVHSTYACLLDESLASIVCPSRSQFSDDPEGKKYYDALIQTILEEVMIAAEYMRYCLCAILLPPCPEPAADNCVPIATVQIRRSDCKVINVCNLTGRRFAATLPNLAYWTSWLPIDQYVRKLLARICCETILKPDLDVQLGDMALNKKVMYVKTEAKPEAAAEKAAKVEEMKAQPLKADAQAKAVNINRDMASIFSQAFERGANRLDLPTMILGAMGVADAEGKPLLTEVEQRNPLTALMANQLAMPLASSFMPQNMLGMTSAADLRKAILGGETPAVSAAEIQSLKAAVSKLTELVNQQQETINTLNKKTVVKKKPQ